MEEKAMVKVIDENGIEKEVEILNYFTLKSNNKKYLVYTENKQDAKGNIIIHTSEVVETNSGIELTKIEDDKILQEIKSVLIELAKDGE